MTDQAAAKLGTAPTDADRIDRIDPGHLRDLLGYHLRRAEVFTFQSFARHLKAFDISPGQLGVMLVVENNPGINQTRAGKALGVDRSTLVSIIDKLESRALIERASAPNDRRSHALMLTDAGRDFIGQLKPSLIAHEDEVARNLSADERRTLNELLGRIVGP